MKLFKIEIQVQAEARRSHRHRYDRARAIARAAAEDLLRGKYLGCTIVKVIETSSSSANKHFVIADVVDD
jgi:hypothetical protein